MSLALAGSSWFPYVVKERDHAHYPQKQAVSDHRSQKGTTGQEPSYKVMNSGPHSGRSGIRSMRC
jgi:hypothetical protein